MLVGSPLTVTFMLSGYVFADAVNEKTEPEGTSVFSAGTNSLNFGFAQALVLLC